MKYACLVYCDENDLYSRPDSPTDAECITCAEALTASGHMLAGEALEPIRTAATVRLRNGEMAITDGPFAETKEQLAGFYLIDAVDLEEATRIGARIPAARVGSVEVRPVRELTGE